MIQEQLLPNEIDVLSQKYRLTIKENNDPLSFKCNQLLDVNFTNEYFDRLLKKFGVSEKFVVASQFVKRYSFMVAVPYLFSVSVWNKQLQIDLNNTSLQSEEKEGAWLPKMYMHSLQTTSPDLDRNGWREQAMKELFSNHLNEVFKILAKQAKVSRQVLWENTALYVFWIYESMMEKYPENKVIQEDFHYLLHADGRLFGDYTYNPIGKYYTEKRYVPVKEEVLRVRKTCCFYNRLPGVTDSCNTCPQTCKIKVD